MFRSRCLLAVALMMVLLVSVSGRAVAQNVDTSSSGNLQSVGANDLGFQSLDVQTWLSMWTLSRLGSPSVYGWGRSTVRSGSGRVSTAVLRERRGLMR